MAYRNKTYVAFDGDYDIKLYNLMKAWKDNGNIAFDFHDAHEFNNIWSKSNEETIKRNLKVRLVNAKVFILLIGEHTKYLYKYVRWEIDYALKHNIPIIAVNLNGSRCKDSLCPPLLKEELVMFVAYKQKIIDYALNNWPVQHNSLKKEFKSGSYYYTDKVYKDLGL